MSAQRRRKTAGHPPSENITPHAPVYAVCLVLLLLCAVLCCVQLRLTKMKLALLALLHLVCILIRKGNCFNCSTGCCVCVYRTPFVVLTKTSLFSLYFPFIFFILKFVWMDFNFVFFFIGFVLLLLFFFCLWKKKKWKLNFLKLRKKNSNRLCAPFFLNW